MAIAGDKDFWGVKRETARYRPVCERVKDFRAVALARSEEQSRDQAGRCMDCGTPFCHWGCPAANFIPEWNDLVRQGHWRRAFDLLQGVNPFPEFTGRLCPAICEYACVLGENDDPVTIRENELAIVEQAFNSGYAGPRPPQRRAGKKVAVVGSGPAGLACADRLNKLGYNVAVFERDDKPGGILRYGIPDFKLEKWVIDRRLDILRKEGVEFETGADVGRSYSTAQLLKGFDAVCLSGGSRAPRDLDIEGRELAGVHFAMDYLVQSNRRVAGENIPADNIIDARGKRVVVIGGGDTGSDCLGTAHRQGASCVVQLEVMPRPPKQRSADSPWPQYPLLFKTSTSHEEGGERYWSVITRRFMGDKGRVERLSCARVEFIPQDKGRPLMKEVAGSDFEIEADLVILAVGFVHPEHRGPIADLRLRLDKRGNVETDGNYMSSRRGVFSAGDMRRGQSLVVWAISEGRGAAEAIDRYLR